jgi:hypothetical protein
MVRALSSARPRLASRCNSSSSATSRLIAASSGVPSSPGAHPAPWPGRRCGGSRPKGTRGRSRAGSAAPASSPPRPRRGPARQSPDTPGRPRPAWCRRPRWSAGCRRWPGAPAGTGQRSGPPGCPCPPPADPAARPACASPPFQPAQVRDDLLQHAIRELAAGRLEGVVGLTGQGDAVGHGQPHPSPQDFSVPGPAIDGREVGRPFQRSRSSRRHSWRMVKPNTGSGRAPSSWRTCWSRSRAGS